jgi:hypothetical protein
MQFSEEAWKRHVDATLRAKLSSAEKNKEILGHIKVSTSMIITLSVRSCAVHT